MAERFPLLRLMPPADEAGLPAGAYTPERLYARYSSYVAKVAYRLLGVDSEVDDVVHDVFAIAIRKLGRITPDESIRHWLASIAVKRCQQILRWRRVRAVWGAGADVDYTVVPDRGASLESRAIVTRLFELLDTLPAAEKVAWIVRHVEGESLEDVAKICRCSLATAKRRIAAAQTRVEEVMGHD